MVPMSGSAVTSGLRNARAPTSPRSMCFCAIWGCISPSSGSPRLHYSSPSSPGARAPPPRTDPGVPPLKTANASPGRTGTWLLAHPPLSKRAHSAWRMGQHSAHENAQTAGRWHIGVSINLLPTRLSFFPFPAFGLWCCGPSIAPMDSGGDPKAPRKEESPGGSAKRVTRICRCFFYQPITTDRAPRPHTDMAHHTGMFLKLLRVLLRSWLDLTYSSQ
jgi:hypothetical protein